MLVLVHVVMLMSVRWLLWDRHCLISVLVNFDCLQSRILIAVVMHYKVCSEQTWLVTCLEQSVWNSMIAGYDLKLQRLIDDVGDVQSISEALYKIYTVHPSIRPTGAIIGIPIASEWSESCLTLFADQRLGEKIMHCIESNLSIQNAGMQLQYRTKLETLRVRKLCIAVIYPTDSVGWWGGGNFMKPHALQKWAIISIVGKCA